MIVDTLGTVKWLLFDISNRFLSKFQVTNKWDSDAVNMIGDIFGNILGTSENDGKFKNKKSSLYHHIFHSA